MYFNGKLNKLKDTHTYTHHDFKGNFKKKITRVSAFLVLCCDLRHVSTQQEVLKQRALRHLFPELNAI